MYGCVRDVIVNESSVRPWNAPSKAMTASRPVYSRASLTAFSTASVPALKKAARLSPEIGTSSPSRSASSTYSSYATTVKSVWTKRSACSAIACTTFGMTVADVHHPDASDEVDERVAVDVGDRRSTRLRRYDRCVHGERPRDGARLAFQDLSRTRAWNLGSELDHPRRRHRRSLRGAAYAAHASSESMDLQDLDPDPTRCAPRLAARQPRDAPLSDAMMLATATATGRPSARMVLLRGLDERGLFFFTNRTSRKGKELSENPHAALVFHWPELGRQVRVEGRVEEVEPELLRRLLGESAARQPDRRLGVAAVRADRRPGGARRPLRGGRSPLRGRAPSRYRTSGADTGSFPRRSSSGRTARTGCTTASAIGERPRGGRRDRLAP